jgi:hypothetical protein
MLLLCVAVVVALEIIDVPIINSSVLWCGWPCSR